MALKEKKRKMPPSADKEAQKRKKAKRTSYAPYILKVLKQVHPKLRISKQAMRIMESFVGDTFERIASEAHKLLLMAQKDTLGAKEIQSAARLAIPGELSRHAIQEADRACTKYTQEVHRQQG